MDYISEIVGWGNDYEESISGIIHFEIDKTLNIEINYESTK